MAGLSDLQVPLQNLSLLSDSLGSSGSTGVSHAYSIMSESPSSKNDVSSGYINDYSDFDASVCQHTRRNSQETVDTNLSIPDEFPCTEKFAKLVDLEYIPWGEQDIVSILREGRTKELSRHVSVDITQRLSYLLQRPLIRVAKEAQRLSIALGKCTRYEIQTALKIVLSRSLSESCMQTCLKAIALYGMSGHSFKQSKSARCGLHFSVGRFHKWMQDGGVSLRVHEYAAIYLAASMENLLEEIVLMALGKEYLGSEPISVEALEYGIAANAELWGLLQAHDHLICGRNSCGILSLPSSLNLYTARGVDNVKQRHNKQQDRMNGALVKNIEQSLLATCVGSLSEIGELVGRAMHHWYNKPSPVTSSPGRNHPLSWSPAALHVLFYYMKCSQLEHADNPNINPPSVHLTYERPYTVLPPLIEWIRVATAFTEHRHSWVVDDDDVRQAARVLLPGVDCPPRLHGPDEALCTARHLDAQKCAQKFQQDMAFGMLACGRSDLLPRALCLLGQEQLNTINEQGMTPLMYACMRGDEAMVQVLLDAGAKIDLTVPNDSQKYLCVHPETRYWTALTFAAAHGHLGVVQLLLERGASVEGAVGLASDNHCETPLQLAAAAGHYELVALLLSKSADPYLSTLHKNGLAFTGAKGSYNAFVLAAANGHRNVLRKLLSHPVTNQSSDILSLEEILAEGKSDTLKTPNGVQTDLKIKTQVEELKSSSNQNLNENEYVTLDETIYEDNKMHNISKESTRLIHKLSKAQVKSLQEALYHGAENGYLDIALELRNLGVQWSVHSWEQCLAAAHCLRRKTITQCLLKDFAACKIDEYTSEFIYESLPLMFDIFKNSKNEVVSSQLAGIFVSLYGKDPIPPVFSVHALHGSPTRIDPNFVNNPDLSDIQFLIEGKVFYAHKIILVHASSRFRAMLSNKFCEGTKPCIELSDVRYHIFEYIMHYLYNGSTRHLQVETKDILELLGASNFFMLEGLQRHCEALCARKLTEDNCVPIYRHAKLYNAVELLAYCEGFFLTNLVSLTESNDQFRKLLFTTKPQHYDLIHGLLATLTQRLEEKLQHKSKRGNRQ